MLKKMLAVAAMLLSFASFAAVDANKGNAADLDGLKGVGPALSGRIIDARKQGGDFKNWDDFMARVKGMKAKSAAKLSAEGLTVNGESFKGAHKAATKKREPRSAKVAAAG